MGKTCPHFPYLFNRSSSFPVITVHNICVLPKSAVPLIISHVPNCASRSRRSMAATLSLSKLPNLPPELPQHHSKILPLSLKTFKSQNPPTKNAEKLFNQTIILLKSSSLPLTALALPFFLNPEDAVAVGGQFGILEGRSFALIHPIVMGGLFVYTLYAGYLGWQWRRVRTVQDEINELKKQVKPVAVTADGTPAEPPTPSPLDAKIQQLTQERKELVKGSYKDKHFNAGSILLGFGVLESVFGGVNTYFRTGKLFPGPHLYAGAAITVLWAAAAALVPAMQKGNETARSFHIALNALNVLLFIWQILLELKSFSKYLNSPHGLEFVRLTKSSC